jgi:hypothetical protein
MEGRGGSIDDNETIKSPKRDFEDPSIEVAGADLASRSFAERPENAAAENQQRLQCDFRNDEKRHSAPGYLFGSDLKVVEGFSEGTFLRRLLNRARTGEILEELFSANCSHSFQRRAGDANIRAEPNQPGVICRPPLFAHLLPFNLFLDRVLENVRKTFLNDLELSHLREEFTNGPMIRPATCG